MRRFLATTAALVAMALSLSMPLVGTSAHADGEITLRVESVDDTAFPTIRAIVRADRAGKPLEALTAAQVQVTESGAPARVQAVARAVDAQVPLGLVLVIDVSGSMAGAPLESAKASAASLVRGLAPGDGAALVTFSSTVAVTQPMTTDQAVLLDAIAKLQVAGNTALYDAVATGAEVAKASTYQRRAVVLLSDGREAGGHSTRTRAQSLDAVSAAGVLFYGVGYGADIDTPYLEEVASRSGGALFPAPTVARIAEIFVSIESLLRSQFVITFTGASAAANTAPGERPIVVAVQTEAGTGRAERTYVSRRPVPTAAAVVPAPTVIEPPAPPPEIPWGALLGAAAVAAAGGGVYLLRARSQARARRVHALVLTTPDLRPLPAPNVEAPAWVLGRLVVSAGPSIGLSVELREEPITLGTAVSCGLPLGEAPGVGVEHARIWRRDGRPMLHHIDPSVTTRVNGDVVDWASIADGDEIAIGPHVVRYEVVSPTGQLEGVGNAGEGQRL